MTSRLSPLSLRVLAVLAALVIGATGGAIAGCGSGSDNAAEQVTTPTTASTDDAIETVPAPASQAAPSTATPAPGGGTATPAPGTPTTTTPNGGTAAPSQTTSTATTPNTGGKAAPDDTPTSTTGAKQDPTCKPGTGPGQPDPQCEPLSGEDAQDEDPR